MNYRKVNNIFGWVAFGIALFTYVKTMEPTVSFWDCGEFLSCAYKLEVGHSPGAPLFMLIQRLFAIFSGGGAMTGQASEHAAWAINFLSALNSALTGLFLFWTITHFAKKMLVGKETPTASQIALIMGAGMVGSLANTWSDTFWFSAVEAEVYATSSFFTAITLWAALKWEERADEKYADRWLVLIAYLIGLSVCVHLLNLLTIPTVAMIYYYRKFPVTIKGTIIAFMGGVVALAFVQFGVIQYIPKIASWFDVFFTNSLGLPFDVGSIFFLLVIIGLLVYGIMWAKKNGKYHIHLGLLCIVFIIIGYSSYMVAIIRSRADVPIDMTNPDNPLSFLDYVNREQFGQQPIFFGQYYNSKMSEIDTSGVNYMQTKDASGKDKYVKVGVKHNPKYDGDQIHFFPRIWSSQDNHANFYRNMCNLAAADEPTFGDNMTYFFGYQMNWMWWRFFMWNFAGRQNDMEGQLEPHKGNWITGITFLDKMRGLGDTDAMGEGYTRNGAHNKLYLLPFILGVIGIVYQYKKHRNDFWIVMVTFFFTGIAIGIFLNMTPMQPRERDYAFAGCTFTFTIWIGLAVLMIADWLNKATKSSAGVYGSIAIAMLAGPVLMVKEEWDDHDRSHKTLARDVAYNTLMNCAPNAILFTFGDNQTYPLWYAQEIEGFRKDVRIINTSLLGIDWYIDQLKYKTNDADALPMLWKRDAYMGDRGQYVQYYDNPSLGLGKNTYINLIEVCDFMNSDNNSQKVPLSHGGYSNYMPTKNFFVPVPSKEDLVKNGVAEVSDTARIIPEMKFTYPKDIAYKGELAILNIIAGVAKDGWKRPIYFDAGLRQGDYAGTGDYLRLEGTVYRLLPYKIADSNAAKNRNQILGTINTEKSYEMFMKYKYGGGESNNVYFDEPNRHEFVTLRMDASSVANALIAEGKKDKAIKLLDKVMEGITEHSYYYDFTSYYIASAYFQAGAMDKGKKLSDKYFKNCENFVSWVATLDPERRSSCAYDVKQEFQVMQSLAAFAYMNGDTTYAQNSISRMKKMEASVKDIVNMKESPVPAGDDQ